MPGSRHRVNHRPHVIIRIDLWWCSHCSGWQWSAHDEELVISGRTLFPLPTEYHTFLDAEATTPEDILILMEKQMRWAQELEQDALNL